jgi:hypothetical protein
MRCYDIETLYLALQLKNEEPLTRLSFSSDQLTYITSMYRRTIDRSAPVLRESPNRDPPDEDQTSSEDESWLEVVARAQAHEFREAERRDQQARADRFKSAIRDGRSAEVRDFVLNGGDATMTENYAIRWASRNNHIDIARFLLTIPGVDVQASDNSALKHAIMDNNLGMIQLLLTGCTGRISDVQLSKLIHYTITHGNRDTISVLLGNCPQPDLLVFQMFRHAIKASDLPMIRLLCGIFSFENDDEATYFYLLDQAVRTYISGLGSHADDLAVLQTLTHTWNRREFVHGRLSSYDHARMTGGIVPGCKRPTSTKVSW